MNQQIMEANGLKPKGNKILKELPFNKLRLDKNVVDKEAERRRKEEFREAMSQLRTMAVTSQGFIGRLLEVPATNDRTLKII